jgi:hypothetical protein
MGPWMDMKYITPFLIIAAAFVLQLITPAAGAQDILSARALSLY